MSRSKKNWDRLVKFDGNYGIDIEAGIWPGSGLMQKGDVGPKGEVGQKGERGLQGSDGPKGKTGGDGPTGPQGAQGESAYEVALNNGFVGTEAEWLASVKGDKGEIGTQGEKGGFTDLTEDEKDSLKGDQGDKGDKGEAAGVFEFKGSEDSLASIEALPGPHESGDVYKDDATDDLYVWDGTQFVLLSEALDVVKGQKGEVGEKGEDGVKGEKGEGDKGEKGEAGEDGEDGLSAYEIAVKGGFVGDEAAFILSLKGDEGEKGETGDKGAQGDSAYEISQKGIDPAAQLTEDEWLESLKGQKGENYDPLVLDNYYDKGQITQLLDQLPDPDDSYDINSMPPENIAEAGDSGDFLDEDPYHFLYNPGLVAVKSGAIISNSPSPAPFVVRNVVLNNPTGLRGTDYVVLQEVISVGVSSATSYIRTAQPAAATFSPWSESTFDSSAYYNKNEVDNLIAAISYVLEHEAGALKLTDKDSNTQTVQFTGTNGIVVTSESAGINIDGSALTPVPQFQGILQDGQDPAVLQPAASDGQYFIIGYEGVTVSTDPDAQNCTPGDWVIYDTDKWVFLDISSDPGVVTVDVDGGLLTLENSDAANPVIGLSTDDVVTPDELEDYVEKEDLAKVMTSVFINDLADVSIDYTRVIFNGSTNRAVFALNAGSETPDAAGKRSADIQSNTLYLFNESTSGNALLEFYNNINTNASPAQIIRVSGTGSGIGAGDERIGRCVSKSSNGTVLTLVFETANIPVFSQGCPGEVTFDIVTEELDHGAILTYDLTGGLWKAGEAADYVKKVGDTMSGALIVNAKDATANERMLFAVEGDRSFGGAGDYLLAARRHSVEGDQLRYYGPQTYEHEVVTKGFIDSGFLPLTGGQLKPEGNLLTLSVAASDGLAADGNILIAKDSAGDNILRLQNDGKLTVAKTLYVDTIEIDSGLGTLASAITGTYSKGLHITFGDEVQLENHSGQVPFRIYDNAVDMGGTIAQHDPALKVTGEGVRFYRALKIGPDDAPPVGHILTSREGNTPPLWKSIESIIAGANLNFLEKPYTVYTADLVTDLTPEAPDGLFHDGELWYSTSTDELFVYGNGNWWPTSVDWQADITRIDAHLNNKLDLSGGEVTGAVTTTAAITHAKQFATKEYVDSSSGGVEVLSGNKSNAAVGDMWFNTSANVMYLRVN